MSLSINTMGLMLTGAVPCVLVFPGKIDATRLGLALEQSRHAWPSLTARYVSRGTGWDTTWSLDPTDREIPLTVRTLSADRAFPTGDVSQLDMSMYLEPMPEGYTVPNTGAAQVTFRLTYLESAEGVKSVLGISWNHLVFDGYSFTQYITHLSALYEGTPHSPPVYPPVDDVPLAEDLPAHLTAYRIPELEGGDWDQVNEQAARLKASHQLYTVHFSPAAMATLKQSLPPQLSTTDILTGWWVATAEALGVEEVVDTVTYPLNLRPFRSSRSIFPPTADYPLSACGFRRLSLPPPATDWLGRIAQVAAAVSVDVHSLRDADTLNAIVLANSWQLKRMALAGKGFDLNEPAGHVYTNSTVNFNWIQPFGFPKDQVAFHTASTRSRMARMYRSNPKPGEDATQRSVEMSFFTPRDAVAAWDRFVAAHIA